MKTSPLAGCSFRASQRSLAWLLSLSVGVTLALQAGADSGRHHDSDDDDDDNYDHGHGGRAVQIVSPTKKVFGKTYAEWGAEWYRWDLGNPIHRSASLDPDGSISGAGQDGPVWFLAGKSGAQEPVTRDVVVPSDKYVFFPIVNLINDFPCPDPSFQPGPGQTMEQFLAEFAKSIIDTTEGLSVEIDGKVVANPWQYRARSGLFNFTADPGWVAMDPCITGTEQQAVADGFWLMLKPMPLGKHIIKLKGKNVIPGNPPFPFANQDVTLNVNVVRPARVFNPESNPYGLSMGEWSARWWQWAGSIPLDGNHPLQDEVGTQAGRGQQGPVWFLGGVFNASGTATRNITVPYGKALYFPLENTECSTVEPPPFFGSNPAELLACAQSFPKTSMICEIDGRPVTDIGDYEIISPLFTLNLAPGDSVLGIPGPLTASSVDHGYYVMVPPLTPGVHEIRLGGYAPGFQYTIDVTYKITVPRPSKH